jgi:hypothetical protein
MLENRRQIGHYVFRIKPSVGYSLKLKIYRQ